MLECVGLSQPVFLVSGMCQAVDIKLDSSSVPFGAVVAGSQSSRVTVMRNFGDIGASFSWNIDQFSPDFSIKPAKGYSSPGTGISFEIKFCPKNICQDIRNEVGHFILSLRCLRRSYLDFFVLLCVSTGVIFAYLFCFILRNMFMSRFFVFLDELYYRRKQATKIGPNR